MKGRKSFGRGQIWKRLYQGQARLVGSRKEKTGVRKEKGWISEKRVRGNKKESQKIWFSILCKV